MGGKQEWIAGTTFPYLSGLWSHPPAIGGLCRGWGAFPESITPMSGYYPQISQIIADGARSGDFPKESGIDLQRAGYKPP